MGTTTLNITIHNVLIIVTPLQYYFEILYHFFMKYPPLSHPWTKYNRNNKICSGSWKVSLISCNSNKLSGPTFRKFNKSHKHFLFVFSQLSLNNVSETILQIVACSFQNKIIIVLIQHKHAISKLCLFSNMLKLQNEMIQNHRTCVQSLTTCMFRQKYSISVSLILNLSSKSVNLCQAFQNFPKRESIYF